MAVSWAHIRTKPSNQENKRYGHGVALILAKKAADTFLGYFPVSDGIPKIRIKAKLCKSYKAKQTCNGSMKF